MDAPVLNISRAPGDRTALCSFEATKHGAIAVDEDIDGVCPFVERSCIAAVLFRELAHAPKLLHRLEADLFALAVVADPADRLLYGLFATAKAATNLLFAYNVHRVAVDRPEEVPVGLKHLSELAIRDRALAPGDALNAFPKPRT